MPSDSKKPRAACVEDFDDEDEKAVRGTRRSAKTKDKSRGSDGSSSPKSKRVDVIKEQSSIDRDSRRKSTSNAPTQSPRKNSRPPLTRTNHTSPPQLEIPTRPRPDPSYYGVSPNSTYTPNSSIRAKSRPVSYYAGMPISIPTPSVNVSRPPQSRSAFYPSPVAAVPTSYPMASPQDSYMRYATPSESYFEPQRNPLAERFSRNVDPISRTTSAQGMKALTEAYASQMDLGGRRSSIRRNSREAEDILLMPPPPGPIRRQSINRVVDTRDMPLAYSLDSYDESSYYEPRSARQIYPDSFAASRAPRRPSANRSSTYDYSGDQNFRIETSNSGRRRSSYYDDQTSPANSNYEEKVRAAAGYQEEVAGGPTPALTREALRRQERTTASSRSTRSSGSRDESEYKRSATTRTTTSRMEGDGDDIKIKLKGGGTVKIGRAEINCDEGAELNIVRSKGIRSGSERSPSEYGMIPAEDRSTRERKQLPYSRATSKSGYSAPLPVTSRYTQGGWV